MTTPFILMTLACAFMAISNSLQWQRIKRQKKLISDFNEKGCKLMGYGKMYWRQQHDGRDVAAGCLRRMDWKGKGGLNNGEVL